MTNYTDIKYWYLRDHKLFQTLSGSQIRQLCIITGFKKAKKGEMIFFAESNEPRIYLLKKGNIKIVEIDEEGNENIKDILQKGDLFGELELDPNANRNEYAKVLSNDVIICSFLLSDFEKLMIANPQLALNYTRLIGFRLKRIRNSYSNLIFKDAKSRLIDFLKNWAANEGIKDGNKISIQNYLTQQDIAQIICTTRQTAAQLLSEIEQCGAISYSRKEIIIHDFAGLL